MYYKLMYLPEKAAHKNSDNQMSIICFINQLSVQTKSTGAIIQYEPDI